MINTPGSPGGGGKINIPGSPGGGDKQASPGQPMVCFFSSPFDLSA